MALILTEADFANLSLLESPELERRLAGATRLPSDAAPEQLVTMNTMIRYRDMTSGETGEVQLVYPHDARARQANRVSVLSPFGLALLGASTGQVVEREIGGERRLLRIEGVMHQPERAMREFRFLRPT